MPFIFPIIMHLAWLALTLLFVVVIWMIVTGRVRRGWRALSDWWLEPHSAAEWPVRREPASADPFVPTASPEPAVYVAKTVTPERTDTESDRPSPGNGLREAPALAQGRASDALQVIGLDDLSYNIRQRVYRKKAEQKIASQVLPILDERAVRANVLGRVRMLVPEKVPSLPVIDAAEVEFNLQNPGGRLLPRRLGVQAADTLPVIDREQVRASLQQIHGERLPFRRGREPAMPAGVASPLPVTRFIEPQRSSAALVASLAPHPVLPPAVGLQPESPLPVRCTVPVVSAEPVVTVRSVVEADGVQRMAARPLPEIRPEIVRGNDGRSTVPAATPVRQADAVAVSQAMPVAVITVQDGLPAASLPLAAPLVAIRQPAPLPPVIRTEEQTGLPATEVMLPASGRVRQSWSADCLPSLDLLQPADGQQEVCPEEALLERGIVIEEKLAEFKVKVCVVDACAGPVITRFEIEPAVGVRGSQVVNLVKDLARALGLASIRVVETIPGKTCMGLELPNPVRQMIRLSEIFSSPAFLDANAGLTLALGKDITGQPMVMDLARAPHLLVAGTTGSGKSVGVNAMILSLLYKFTPQSVRFIMIDPKMLELSVYNDIPHLLAPVVTDMKLAANALSWCVGEMEKRYRLMSALGVRNLVGFNEKVLAARATSAPLQNPFSLTPDNPEPLESLPFIVVVVDEFADLMMVAGKKIEELIARLAQKARAAGIHLILATQRPSVDVITGLIKANIPTRIAFQVSSKIDSRTILDQMGAEALLGQGDMLFLPPGSGYPQRIHGAFVTDSEVHAVVEAIKAQGEPDYVDGLLTGEAQLDEDAAGTAGRAVGSESDPLYDEAVEIVLRTRKASISSVQRHLRIGYNRAARLIEEMEAAGLVSAMENNGNRTVLVPDRSSGG